MPQMRTPAAERTGKWPGSHARSRTAGPAPTISTSRTAYPTNAASGSHGSAARTSVGQRVGVVYDGPQDRAARSERSRGQAAISSATTPYMPEPTARSVGGVLPRTRVRGPWPGARRESPTRTRRARAPRRRPSEPGRDLGVLADVGAGRERAAGADRARAPIRISPDVDDVAVDPVAGQVDLGLDRRALADGEEAGDRRQRVQVDAVADCRCRAGGRRRGTTGAPASRLAASSSWIRSASQIRRWTLPPRGWSPGVSRRSTIRAPAAPRASSGPAAPGRTTSSGSAPRPG